MLIKHDTIRVKKFEGQEDLTEKLISIFPFAGSNAKRLPPQKYRMNHMQIMLKIQYLGMLSKLTGMNLCS